jgi:hypothetical protein
MAALDTALMCVVWGVVGVLLLVVYRIARFYQITAGRRTYYRFFWLPLGLLWLAALLTVGDNPLLNVWRDVLLLAGGISLIGLSYYLLRLMIGSRS